ncbi:MAG TPA: alkaline phosphatase D family protein [Steroidobacteraceae bacterium]|jgi:alkaline phosphatase D
MQRRRFLQSAAALGASAVWCRASATASHSAWRERREYFPQGVASGDPESHSVLLWTRCPAKGSGSAPINVEVAEDANFARVIAVASSRVAPQTDWTCRVLVGGLKPSHEYFYRFTDADGNGSRIGRTLTAPRTAEDARVRFAFVSCQNINYGAQNAWRRMIYEDERAAPADRLNFVLHLGDFIYELVWYPEDRAEMYDRKVREILRYAHGEKVEDFHIPTTTDDYRTVHRTYLTDPDIQDARARWPFVTMWDNHEFSWLGWQGIEKFDGTNRPAQTRKVAANQAWFEYHPARVLQPSGALHEFNAPDVSDAPVTRFDANGLGLERNNLTAINSLTGYRALRFGAHVDLVITDQHSYRSEDPLGRTEAEAFTSSEFPEFVPEEVQRILDAGRSFDDAKPPATIRFGANDIANFSAHEPPQTVLGATQKTWFLDHLKASRATWKVWANTAATLDMRADPQNLPAGLTVPWPGSGYAGFGGGDPSSAYTERAEIYDFVKAEKITGFATIAGDRHSFWAGLAAKSLPPARFEPVGIAFVTGSLSAPGMAEALEHKFPKEHPLRPLFIADRANAPPEASMNLLLHHGVRSALEYAQSGDIGRARSLSNKDNAPHVAFVDMGGHGYAVVTAGASRFDTEFVCIPRPIKRSDGPDGGSLRYRVVHRTPLWQAGEQPKISTTIVEGDPKLSV